MKEIYYEKPWGMIFGKKHKCSLCGSPLVIEKVNRVVTHSDRDYNSYRRRPAYPRRDISVTSHRYKCSGCKFRFTYDDQCIASEIQKKLGKTVLTDQEIADNYEEISAKREWRYRRNAVIRRIVSALICSVIFWFVIDDTKAAENLLVHVLLSVGFGALLIGVGVLFIKRRNVYDYREVQQFERLHTYSKSNRRLVGRVDRCHCFNCLSSFDSSEIVEYLPDDSAICPNCGVDAVLPDLQALDINAKVLLDMHEYWL